MSHVFSSREIEQFIELGWVRLSGAYRPEDALSVQNVIWHHIEERGVHQSDPSTWTEALVHLRESYSGPEFDRCNTVRLQQAIEELVGEDRLLNRDHPAWGWWPVNFSVGADRPWTVPDRGWHWDGHHFRHFVDSPDQGLLCLCVFSEIGPRGGGTLLAEGSHRVVARLLDAHPEGIELVDAITELNQTHAWFGSLTSQRSPSLDGELAGETSGPDRVERFMQSTYRDHTGQGLRVIELTADPGDVFLCHPFLYHAASQNHSGKPRFLCNRIGTLKTPMRIRKPRSQGHWSPVEVSIHQALS